MRNQTAERHARKVVEQRKHRFEHRATDILKIDVDALRAGVLQFGRKIGIAVIQALVEAELVLHVSAFVLTAGNADRARPLDPCDLADRRTNCT